MRCGGLNPILERAALARARGIRAEASSLDRQFLACHSPFDVVVLADVLEHVAAPAELLKLAVAALKPEDLVLLAVPNVAHWTVRLILLRGRVDYADTRILKPTPLRWFTQKTVRALCPSCGPGLLCVPR